MTERQIRETNIEDKSSDNWIVQSETSAGRSENRTKRKSMRMARKLAKRHMDELAKGWFDSDSDTSDEIASLDDQQPATLYYLDLVRKVPQVSEIYVEPLERGRIKHWTVLAERDYDAMESIYEIEDNTLDHFPSVELRFRVTVDSEDGPSTSPRATQIYPTQ